MSCPPRVSSRTTRFLSPIALLAVGSCAVAVSQTPLSNSEPAKADVYFYGPHVPGGKAEPAEPEKDTKRQRAPVKLPHPPSLTTVQVAKETPKKLHLPDLELDGGAGALAAPLDVAGRYSGTDTVTILLQGIPSDPQVDENAKIDVKEVGEQRVSVTVVDSSQGTALCTIEGKIAGGEVAFDPGQDCFTQILGIPAEAHITSGSAKIADERLTVDFEVALEIAAPGATLEGSVDYHFEGTKLKSP